MSDPGSKYHLLLVAFDPNNRVLLHRSDSSEPWRATAQAEVVSVDDPDKAGADLVRQATGLDLPFERGFGVDHPDHGRIEVLFLPIEDIPSLPARELAGWFTLEQLTRMADRLDPILTRIVPGLRVNAVRIGYLTVSDRDYIYRFRTDRQRNREAYLLDDRARHLYHSRLCQSIKEAKRSRERTSAEPAVLDFGPVRYVLPSHFGFCLGVQNAIERAYETLARYPARRVFMLSELIHNPFVNEDLQSRGLLYLQTDRGRAVTDPATNRPYWDDLTSDDVVIIPAFGATEEDKKRLIEKGIAVRQNDATCMLVEKVWKVARGVGMDGYTVIIHGKEEHEETKATFSNSAREAPSLIIRNLEDARIVGEMILEDGPARIQDLFQHFAGRHTPGFDPSRDLDRIAVVNQTTLLRNETVAIIDHLESILTRKFGADRVGHHLYGQSRGDTLCYATQVNQDSLEKALQLKPDVAVVVGGRNSSNTYQLYRLCAQAIDRGAFYVQSERNILSVDSIEHFRFPTGPADTEGGRTESRAFLPTNRPLTVLVTGGASCPDGIIQMIIERINHLLGDEELRSIDDVLNDTMD